MDKIRKPSHYVGIGASAGGLEAIESFFTNMPVDNNLAFIVIQHLSPDYKSLMVELLSKKTAMTVNRAEDGMEVEPNQVYLIPPKKNLAIFHGKLLLRDRSEQEGISLPIDIFLQSLAEDQGDRAIAIILSGTGSDGARGVRAVKEHNGMVMVQDEETAKFDGMPRAAISTGTADFILAPEKMPRELMAYVAHPYISGEKRTETLLEDADSLTRLFAELRGHTKVDFTYYKPSTISRRIERRMSINQITDFDEYVRYLQSNRGETTALYRELLIGVTSFFRDPEAMAEMQEQVLPSLLKRVRNRELRCWVAGCSSGEEAYTMAILFKEAMAAEGISQDIKIFATDVDREAITRASSGVYPESIAADMTPRILGKYFYRREDSYQVARYIREMVVFAQHNLIKDPPFTNIDLVSCRNLLIYLQPVLQNKALEMFNFSLNPKGILMLGNSETVGEMVDYFKPLHQRLRIYESRGKVQPLNTNVRVSDREGRAYQPQSFGPIYRSRRDSDVELTLLRNYLAIAAENYIPLSIIVNEHLEIVHIVGNTEGFFSVPSGPAEYNITRLAAKELAIPLATGIQKVFRTGEEISYTNVRLAYRGENRTISLRIVPLPQRKGQEATAAVFIEETAGRTASSPSEIETYDVNEDAQQRIRDLEQELQFSQENLQATIEELETSNEELQATNEELLASNEELQSTNEELQSTNEELYTVNAEHQNRIIELTELSNDVDNLLTSSRIGTLIIDENFEIRKYSPEITRIFNILEKDVGRPFSHLSHQLVDFDPVAAVAAVQDSGKAIEKDVRTSDGRWYLARILPYHIGPQTYSGIVMTFVDITEQLSTRRDLLTSRQVMSDIRQNIPVGLLVYRYDDKDDFILENGNPEAERVVGFPVTDSIGSRFEEIWPESDRHGFVDCFRKVMATGETCVLDNLHYQDDRVDSYFRVHAFSLPDNRLAVSFEDISLEKQAQQQLEQSERKYRTLFETMELGVVYQDSEGRIISVNPAAERILGLSFDQLSGLTSGDPRWQAISEDGLPLEGDQHPAMVALRTGEPVTGKIMGLYTASEEDTRWISVNATPLFREGEKKPYQVFATFEEVTRRVAFQRRLEYAGNHLDQIIRSSDLNWWEWDIPADTVSFSTALRKRFGLEADRAFEEGGVWRQLIHPDDYDRVIDERRRFIESRSDTYEVRYRLQSTKSRESAAIERGEITGWDRSARPVRFIGMLELAGPAASEG